MLLRAGTDGRAGYRKVESPRMTQIPIFIPNKQAHLLEAKRWAERIPHYPEKEKKSAAKMIVKHLKAAIENTG
jgi:hypothetical protein